MYCDRKNKKKQSAIDVKKTRIKTLNIDLELNCSGCVHNLLHKYDISNNGNEH